MRRSLFDRGNRTALLGRLQRLTPDTRPRWGRMTATRMLAHLNDGFALAYGELTTRQRRTWLRIPPVNLLVACAIPFPRSAPTPKELIAREPNGWDVEMDRFSHNLEAFTMRARTHRWPDHPFFGRMPGWAWGYWGTGTSTTTSDSSASRPLAQRAAVKRAFDERVCRGAGHTTSRIQCFRRTGHSRWFANAVASGSTRSTSRLSRK